MTPDDDSTTEPPDDHTDPPPGEGTVLAELEGGLTETQLTMLTAAPSLVEQDAVAFSDRVYMSEAIPPEQFTALCGFYVGLLSNDIDIDIEALRATPESVHVDYLDESTTPEESGDIVEHIAGSYAAMFSDEASWVGDPLPTLNAVGADSDGAISWQVEPDVAEQFLTDDISEAAFLDHIYSTIEEL